MQAAVKQFFAGKPVSKHQMATESPRNSQSLAPSGAPLDVEFAAPQLIDVGGEGRWPLAWNVNPRANKTLNPGRGETVPRRIAGSASAIPLPDASVLVVLVERTPLTRAACREIRRVAKPGGFVVLRHVPMPGFDRHGEATRWIPGISFRTPIRIGSLDVQQTVIRVASESLALNSAVEHDVLRLLEHIGVKMPAQFLPAGASERTAG